jgi:hypothetical protein
VKLPNGDRALVEDAKLLDYCLNPNHPRGRHKSRIFESVLGITRLHVALLRHALLAAAANDDAAAGESDQFGNRYVIDFDLAGPTGRARVRSAWIVRSGEDYPRLVTCYVL